MVDLSSLINNLEDDSPFEEIPVDLDTFMGEDYLGMESYIKLGPLQKDVINYSTQIFDLETLKQAYGTRKANNIFKYTKNEVINVLGKGAGKDLMAEISCAYVVYKLLCLKDPARFFGKPPGDAIDIVNVAINADQAQRVFFKGFTNIIKRAPWFAGKVVAPKQRVYEFDKSISVHSGHSEMEAFEGLNCYSGVTKVLTDQGYVEIGSLAGRTVRLVSSPLNSQPRWQAAEIKHFGKQQTFAVELKRNKVTKTLYATAGHRWFQAKGGRRYEHVTTDLQPGMHLWSTSAPERWSRTKTLSKIGVMHGAVLGDGDSSRGVSQNHVQSSRLRLYGESKQAALGGIATDLFGEYTVDDPSSADGIDRTEPCFTYIGVPAYLNALPDLTELDSQYLISLLAGYIATDGTVNDHGATKISSKTETSIEFLYNLCSLLGVHCFEPNRHTNPQSGLIHTITIPAGALPERFYLRQEHRSRVVKKSGVEKSLYRRNHEEWVVQSVTLAEEEDVYCAVVPEAENFVIEGNILSGNCIMVILDEISGFAMQAAAGAATTVSPAEATYNMYKASLTSRFPDQGKLIMLSFPRSTTDFISKKYKDAIGTMDRIQKSVELAINPDYPIDTPGNRLEIEWTEDHIIEYTRPGVWALRRPSWEINPTRKIEHYKTDFLQNYKDAKGRFAAEPTDGAEGFFSNHDVIKTSLQRRNGVNEETGMFETWFKPRDDREYFMHIDLARKHDRAVAAIAHVDRWVHQEIFPGQFENLPYVIVDAYKYWTPTRETQINFIDVKNFPLELARMGFDIEVITLDQWDSGQMTDYFNGVGMRSEKLSVGLAQYNDLKLMMNESRVHIPHSDILELELHQLKYTKNLKNVDHPHKGGKDIADAVAGAVFNAATRSHSDNGTEAEVLTLSDIHARMETDKRLAARGVKPEQERSNGWEVHVL